MKLNPFRIKRHYVGHQLATTNVDLTTCNLFLPRKFFFKVFFLFFGVFCIFFVLLFSGNKSKSDLVPLIDFCELFFVPDSN